MPHIEAKEGAMERWIADWKRKTFSIVVFSSVQSGPRPVKSINQMTLLMYHTMIRVSLFNSIPFMDLSAHSRSISLLRIEVINKVLSVVHKKFDY